MPFSSPRFLVLFLFIATVSSSSALAQTASAPPPATTLAAVTSSQSLRDGIELRSDTATLRITALRDDIVRVRVSANSALPEDASWAVLPETRSKSVDVKPIQDDAAVGFRTAALEVRVERSPLRLVIRDLAGNVISADALGRPVTFQLGGF